MGLEAQARDGLCVPEGRGIGAAAGWGKEWSWKPARRLSALLWPHGWALAPGESHRRVPTARRLILPALRPIACIHEVRATMAGRSGIRTPRRQGAHIRKNPKAEALGLQFVVGDTRFELVTSSVSGKRSPPELIARSGCALRAEATIPEPPGCRKGQFQRFLKPRSPAGPLQFQPQRSACHRIPEPNAMCCAGFWNPLAVGPVGGPGCRRALDDAAPRRRPRRYRLAGGRGSPKRMFSKVSAMKRSSKCVST